MPTLIPERAVARTPPVTQHASLTVERWAEFDLGRQILMIANEMNRAGHSLGRREEDSLRKGYERVLRLVDLTVACREKPTLRRELLRWRGLVAELYVSRSLDEQAFRAVFKALLQLEPGASKQIEFLVES